MTTPKRKAAADSIKKLVDRVDQLTAAKSCPRLLHLFIPGSPPSITPGCPRCAAVKQQHDAWAPPAPAPRPTPTERRRQMLEDVPTFPPESHP